MSSETTVATVGKVSTLGGIGTTFGSAAMHYDLGMLCGILIGVIGIVIQLVLAVQKWTDTRRSARLETEHDRREAEFHDARMLALKSGIKLEPREDQRQISRDAP